MSVVPQANMNTLMDYNAFILRMRDVVNGAKIIQALHRTGQEEWDRSFDASTDRHFIKGVFTSPEKSEAVKTYIAKVVKLHMISTGSRLTAWTKDTVASENPTNIAISNRIAATEFKSSTELFLLVATRLIGYDDALVKFALETNVDVQAKLLMDYLSAQFDLSVNGEKPHLMYIDQTIDLSILLKTEGFTPKFFIDHLYQAGKYFEAFEGVTMNHWDLFDILDVVVQVNQDHADSAALYAELSGATKAETGVDPSAFLLEVDPDDADPSTTIEVCAQHYNGMNVVLPKDIDYTSEFKDWLVVFAKKMHDAGRTFSVKQVASVYNYAESIQTLEEAQL
jgi:hypothetical protein